MALVWRLMQLSSLSGSSLTLYKGGSRIHCHEKMGSSGGRSGITWFPSLASPYRGLGGLPWRELNQHGSIQVLNIPQRRNEIILIEY